MAPPPGTVPGARRILALALPALGALAADPVLSLVDTAFVGRLGPVPLAALGIDTALFSFAFALFNFLAYATTPMVATARGRGDVAGSGRVVLRALTLAVLIGVVSMLLLGGGAPLFVRMMQAGPGVVDPAVSYLRIRSAAVPALLVITASHGAYRGFHDTRTPLIVTLAVNAFNAVLDPVLMFGAGLGIEGAALATLIAQWIGAGIFLVLLRRKGRTESWPPGRVRLTELRPFLAVGGVLVLRTLLLVGSLTAATAVAARVGTVEVAAHQVVSQLWFLLAMIVDALAIAAQAMVAGLYGRDDPVAARALAARLLRWGAVVGIVLALLLLAARPFLGGWFTDDPAIVAAIRQVLPIAALMQPLAALVFVADGIFLSVLATRLLALSTGAGFVATVAVLAATVWLGLGLVGVWWAIVALVAARALVLGRAYRSGLTASSA